MFFYLTTLNFARFLKETTPQVEPPKEGQPSNAQAMQDVEALKHSDFLCHSYVPNGLVDSLYNMYCKTTTAKELWESLKRKRKEISVEDSGGKGGSRPSQMAQKNTYAPDSAKANMVEHAESCLKSNFKGKGKEKRKKEKKSKWKAEYLAPKNFQETCYNCDQPGHRASSGKMPGLCLIAHTIYPRPIRLGDLSSWDLDKATWGGQVEAIGTVPVCCRCTGRLGEGMGCFAGKWGKGSYLLF
nr:hypothetical protein [Tanacetum cinerariifolium]